MSKVYAAAALPGCKYNYANPDEHLIYLSEYTDAVAFAMDVLEGESNATVTEIDAFAISMGTCAVLETVSKTGCRMAYVTLNKYRILNNKPTDVLAYREIPTEVASRVRNSFGLSKRASRTCMTCIFRFRDIGKEYWIVFNNRPDFFEKMTCRTFHDGAPLAKHVVMLMDDMDAPQKEALEKYARNACAVCEGPMPKKQFCGGCMRSRFCSTECQRVAWRGGHKAMCPRLMAL